MARAHVRDLPPPLAGAAVAVAKRLASVGHRAWIVGGAVRDLVLGIPPKDLDIASAATPDELETLFPNAIGVGRAFGTLTLPGHGFPLEVSTFREDGIYTDRRRPDSVAFGSELAVDARRRDFTINALYLDPLTDQLEDPEGGLADLDAKRLRAVGEPMQRLGEDRLRVLRLARFAGRFGFEVDARTWAAAQVVAGDLHGLAAERVAAELRSIFHREGFERAIALLEALGVREHLFAYSLPPQDSKWVRGALLTELAGDGAGPPELALGLAAWWLPSSAPSQPPSAAQARSLARSAAEHLKLSRSESAAIQGLWQALANLPAWPEQGHPTAFLIRLLRSAPLPELLRLVTCLPHMFPAGSAARLRALVAGGALEPREVLLSGERLAALGIARGPGLGAWLHALETLQLEGRLTDVEQAIAHVRSALARGEAPGA